MGTTYQLVVVNGTRHFRDFCVYQTDPDIGVRDVKSLAWFVDGGHHNTRIVFEWEMDYSFVWSEVEKLQPGVVFRASQYYPADPADAGANHVQLDYTEGAYNFVPDTTTTYTKQRGSLYIWQTGNVPLDEASVGIGMSGSGTFVVEAEPNELLVFTPRPRYWVTAGTYRKGEVLDIMQLTNPAQVQFPPGVFTMTATLTAANLWEVTPVG